MEENNRLIEEAVKAVARQLEGIVRLQGERMAQLEDRMARLEGKLAYLKGILYGGGKTDNMEPRQAGIATRDNGTCTESEPPRTPHVSRPTEEQAFEYMRTCNGRTLREDVARKMAREFIGYNDKRGWKNNSGEAIVVWENCALGWVRRQAARKGESIYEQPETGGMNLKISNTNH